MTWDWRVLVGAIVLVVAAVAVQANQPTPTPTPPPPTSSTTSTTIPPEYTLDRVTPPPPDGLCERLNAATSGETIWVDGGALPDVTAGGTSKDFACDVRATGVDAVTVSGHWTGDLHCRDCDGWVFTDVVINPGSLRMIGGTGWTITKTTIVGGNRGLMAVMGTGADDSLSTPSPTRWSISDVDVGGAGCRPAGDPNPSHVRALYLNGRNGTPNDGFVVDSRFWGAPCGYTAKVGSTANFGVHAYSGDAADNVTFARNTVEVVDVALPEGVPRQATPLLVSGHSDNVTFDDNTLIGGDVALWASGPFTGHNLRFTNNRFDQDLMIRWRRYGPPPWYIPTVPQDSPLAPAMGETFARYPTDPCPPLGTCSGNIADTGS